MRTLILILAAAAGLMSLAGCVGDTVGAVRAMNNPPNSCGPGGSRNVEDCRGHPW